MRRPVAWTHRCDDGVKREVRVTFTGRGGLRWQAKRSDSDAWVYDFQPSQEDWDLLEGSMAARYQRRNVPIKDVELVKRLKQSAVQPMGTTAAVPQGDRSR